MTDEYKFQEQYFHALIKSKDVENYIIKRRLYYLTEIYESRVI